MIGPEGYVHAIQCLIDKPNERGSAWRGVVVCISLRTVLCNYWCMAGSEGIPQPSILGQESRLIQSSHAGKGQLMPGVA